MKTTFMTFFMAVFLTSLFGQKEDFKKYYELINIGNDAYDSAKYRAAAQYFKVAFTTVSHPFAKALEKYVAINIKADNYRLTTAFAEQAAKSGYIIQDTLIAFLSRHTGDHVNRKYLQQIEKESLASKKATLMSVIDSLLKVDQSFRYNSAAFTNQGNVDSANTYFLLQAIKQYGFPSEQNVGYTAASNAFIIFLHADFDRNNDLLGPILLQAVKNGEFQPVWYAQVCDRRCNFSGKQFMYYQVPFGYDQLSTNDKEVVTQRRKDIGLRSVEKTIEYKFLPGGTLQTRMKE